VDEPVDGRREGGSALKMPSGEGAEAEKRAADGMGADEGHCIAIGAVARDEK